MQRLLEIDANLLNSIETSKFLYLRKDVHKIINSHINPHKSFNIID